MPWAVALKRQKKKKKKRQKLCSSCCGTAETNPTRNDEVVGSVPGLAQWVKEQGVGGRGSSDLALL